MITQKEAQEAFKKGDLKAGMMVRINQFDEPVKVSGVYMRPARMGELEDDWLVVLVGGKEYDAGWIEEIYNYEALAAYHIVNSSPAEFDPEDSLECGRCHNDITDAVVDDIKYCSKCGQRIQE